MHSISPVRRMKVPGWGSSTYSCWRTRTSGASLPGCCRAKARASAWWRKHGSSRRLHINRGRRARDGTIRGIRARHRRNSHCRNGSGQGKYPLFQDRWRMGRGIGSFCAVLVWKIIRRLPEIAAFCCWARGQMHPSAGRKRLRRWQAQMPAWPGYWNRRAGSCRATGFHRPAIRCACRSC